MNTTSFTDGSTLPQIITETSVREGKESTSASEGVSWGGGGGGVEGYLISIVFWHFSFSLKCKFLVRMFRISFCTTLAAASMLAKC